MSWDYGSGQGSWEVEELQPGKRQESTQGVGVSAGLGGGAGQGLEGGAQGTLRPLRCTPPLPLNLGPLPQWTGPAPGPVAPWAPHTPSLPWPVAPPNLLLMRCEGLGTSGP